MDLVSLTCAHPFLQYIQLDGAVVVLACVYRALHCNNGALQCAHSLPHTGLGYVESLLSIIEWVLGVISHWWCLDRS